MAKTFIALILMGCSEGAETFQTPEQDGGKEPAWLPERIEADAGTEPRRNVSIHAPTRPGAARR